MDAPRFKKRERDASVDPPRMDVPLARTRERGTIESAQPRFRIDRLSFRADLEVEPRRLLTAAGAARRERLADVDPVADVFQQSLVAAVKAEIAVAVIDDDHEAVATEPVGEHDAAVRDRVHGGAGFRGEQKPARFSPRFVRGAKAAHDLALHRPGETAAL